MNIDYLAGFFDGEGSINITKLSNTYRVVVSITQCDRGILDEIRDFLGYGCVNAQKITSRNKTQPYRLNLQSAQSYKFLKQIRSKLRLKRKEADLAISLHEYKKNVRPKSGPGTSFSHKQLRKMQDIKNELEMKR